jgi:hypothetical protein
MDLQALSALEGYTPTALLLTAAICLVSVFIAWYTVRTRIQLSQVILGIFSFLLVMLLENVFTVLQLNLNIPDTGVTYGIYFALSIVLSREIIRFLVMKFALCERFEGADAAIGFGLGFAGLYLLTCAFYYFSMYSTVKEYLSSGSDAFFVSAGTDSQEAYELLLSIAAQDWQQYLVTAVDRVVFLVREMALSVLLWYGFTDAKMRRCLLLVPVVHFLAMLPDGMYNASVLQSFYGKELMTLVISAGIVFLAAKVYDKKEDQVAHFQVEKLRARRRR